MFCCITDIHIGEGGVVCCLPSVRRLCFLSSTGGPSLRSEGLFEIFFLLTDKSPSPTTVQTSFADEAGPLTRVMCIVWIIFCTYAVCDELGSKQTSWRVLSPLKILPMTQSRHKRKRNTAGSGSLSLFCYDKRLRQVTVPIAPRPLPMRHENRFCCTPTEPQCCSSVEDLISHVLCAHNRSESETLGVADRITTY